MRDHCHSMVFGGAFMALWLSTALVAHGGTVLYVDDDAAPGGDGAAWRSAYRHLQDALAYAALPANGVTAIRVAQGVYRPDRTEATPAGTGDRAQTFRLISGVQLEGGYAGLEAAGGQSPDERDVALYPSVLSGDLAGDDGKSGTFENAADNSFQVVVALNVDETAVLDGLVITAGHADGPAFGAVPESKDQGSGLNVYFASPTIRDCTFAYNWNSNHGAINDHGHSTVINCSFIGNFAVGFGAGLYIHHHSETVAIDCTFSGNRTPGDGAGAYSRSMHHPMFMNCTFNGNVANRGAGLWAAERSNVEIIECTFISNQAGLGGGMYHFRADPAVSNCQFIQNVVEAAGAGVYSDASTGSFTDCTFFENIAPSGGGGMWNAEGAMTISNCLFTSNIGSVGAAVYNGDFGVHTISDCTFTYNSGFEGAGVYNIFSDSSITDCTFIGNTASGGTFSVGGGASNYFCNPTYARCTFTRNSAELGGGGMYNEGEQPRITACRFQGNRAAGETYGWGGGVLSGYFTSPEFINCSFVGNVAQQGGAALHVVFSAPRFINCAMSSNLASDGGGALHGYTDETARLTNCIIWGNSAPHLGGTLPAITYSCVENGFAGQGNVASAPMFASDPSPGPDGVWATSDDEFGDLRLLPQSPCIDAGDNAALPPTILVDLADQKRFADDLATPDTGNAAGMSAVVDIGPLERQDVECAADIAPRESGGDGLVNVHDLLAVIATWGEEGGPADVNADGVVNVEDLLAVIAAWGPCL